MNKILVIEDEDPLREEILDILSFEDFEGLGGRNGREGIEIAREQVPDLIICDVTMPEMDGYQTLLALRENPLTATIPFIFLTARADRSFVRHGMELGADDYLTKPFTRGELLTAIRARLERQAALVATTRASAEEAKLKLTRMVAHELRTPLVSMSNILSLISRQLGRLSEHELQELLYTHEASNRRLARLVEQMVLRLQFEVGALSRDTVLRNGMAFPVHKLLTAAMHLARRFAYRNDDGLIQIEGAAGNVEVMCENHLLKHALAELITNALTFSPENEEVVISSHVHDDALVISIVDQGQGMAQSQIDIAMQEFQQISRDVQEQQGIGLGLALARQIIELHGGELELKSVEGEGTQAIVRLPLHV